MITECQPMDIHSAQLRDHMRPWYSDQRSRPGGCCQWQGSHQISTLGLALCRLVATTRLAAVAGHKHFFLEVVRHKANCCNVRVRTYQEYSKNSIKNISRAHWKNRIIQSNIKNTSNIPLNKVTQHVNKPFKPGR